MDKLERAYCLDKILKQRRYPVSLDRLCDELECGKATVKRQIYDMRLYLDAPIINKPGQGYFYAKNNSFELPGIWFSADELYALLTIQKLAANLSGGFFDVDIRVIQHKVQSLLGSNPGSIDEINRIRVLGSGSRGRELPCFATVADAVFRRKRVHILYEGRERGQQTQRDVSPQRLTHYRSNWYLDAWCHKAEGLRTFAVEKINQARLIDAPCKEITAQVLDERLAHSFGIFAGEPEAEAVLRFTEKAARWVADEAWFPNCAGLWLEGGDYELRIPYANPTELIMEICRHGPDVEVIAPQALRDQVAKRLAESAKKYAHGISM